MQTWLQNDDNILAERWQHDAEMMATSWQNDVKFISRKFFFDLELVVIYSKKKLNILSVKTNYVISKKSSIKIFNLKKNIEIIKELIKVVIFYKKIN